MKRSPKTKDIKISRRARLSAAAALFVVSMPLWLPAAMQQQNTLPVIKPQVPTANRQDGKHVFLEHADELNKQLNDSFLILIGNVVFSKGGMWMYCDSANYYPEKESLDAFYNVRMEQGDTLFVYGDSLKYRSETELATLWGEPVRMINNDVELETDRFVYDLYSEFGYYDTGGVLTDKQNRLVSVQGEYVPSTKEATFYRNVRLNSITESNDTLFIHTDTLYYNTDAHLAELFSESTIISHQDTIFTTYGTYDTETELANLYERSLVKMQRGTTLEGDTLFYDKMAGYGWAKGNMVLRDSIRQSMLTGEYGYYDQIADSSYVTGRALAKEYSQGDTMYVHGREIFTFPQYDTIYVPEDTILHRRAYEYVDTTHVLVAHPRVRFFRSDMQGICDSLRFEERDSVLYLLRHPIVWSDDRQIFGNVIQLHLNDSTIDHAVLPDFGFTAQMIEEGYFNQLSGKEMIAYFKDGEMTKLDVNGNVEAIMMPMENDSTYNKIVNIESSFMTADFEHQALMMMKMWPETSGTVTPLYLAKKSLFFLPKFKWYTGLRPESPMDVFVIPPEMDELMASAEPVSVKRALPSMTRPAPTRPEPRMPHDIATPDSLGAPFDSISADTIDIQSLPSLHPDSIPQAPTGLDSIPQSPNGLDSIPALNIPVDTIPQLPMPEDSIPQIPLLDPLLPDSITTENE
ncbi:MAG: hypothetical protein LIP03_01165 [Bacteroidales bacterium]|nr:hypothetical protein [Bacteroidales bacterium]